MHSLSTGEGVTDDIVLAGGALRARADWFETAACWTIVISLALRTIVALTFGLSADESYGIGVSHDLNLSYFDHAPLSYWIIHVFLPVLGDGRAIRLPFVTMFAVTMWLQFLTARRLFGDRAAFWTVFALAVSGFFTLAGGWALPDGPLMLFLSAAANQLARGLFPAGERAPSPWRTWLIAGLWFGLAGLSKYSAVLIGAGAFAFVVTARPQLLRHPAPWVGALIAAACLLPVLVWNAGHDWASLAFQSSRSLSDGDFPKYEQFFADIGGQFGYLLPWVMFPMLIAVGVALRAGRDDERAWLSLCLGLPAVLFFTANALWGERAFPHWTMPGWLMMFPLLGRHVAGESLSSNRLRQLAFRAWTIGSPLLLVALAFVVVGYVETGVGKRLMTTEESMADPALDFIEWTPLRDELKRRGLLDRGDMFIVSYSPADIGTINQTLGDIMPMAVYGKARQYAFRTDPATLVGRDALIIGRSDRIYYAERLAAYFDSVDELPAFTFGRNGMKEIEVVISYGHRLKAPLPVTPYVRD